MDYPYSDLNQNIHLNTQEHFHLEKLHFPQKLQCPSVQTPSESPKFSDYIDYLMYYLLLYTAFFIKTISGTFSVSASNEIAETFAE